MPRLRLGEDSIDNRERAPEWDRHRLGGRAGGRSPNRPPELRSRGGVPRGRQPTIYKKVLPQEYATNVNQQKLEPTSWARTETLEHYDVKVINPYTGQPFTETFHQEDFFQYHTVAM